MTAKAPAASATHQEHMIRPQHTNARGSVFGGDLMAWVDTVAATAAMRHCGKAVVTASIDSLHFLAPIPLGWVACLDARVNFASKTSCEVGVKVSAYNPITSESHHTASAYLTFVALDSNGRPTPIPKIAPETDEDRHRFQAAELRRKVRLELKEKLTRRHSD